MENVPVNVQANIGTLTAAPSTISK